MILQSHIKCIVIVFNSATYVCRDLNLKKGDLVLLLQRIDENWFIGEISGEQGYLPANFVEVK